MKKAEINIDELGKLMLILLALALIFVGIYILRDKFASLFASIKTFLRFG